MLCQLTVYPLVVTGMLIRRFSYELTADTKVGRPPAALLVAVRIYGTTTGMVGGHRVVDVDVVSCCLPL